ncbi:MAG: ABC transporter ATP-binding protein, partial [Deltaproteobacteria bacterium]|nr:ABC transporter ATP-binding protein [Deltaproteobacteria bacterium]
KKINRERRATMIYTSHYMDEIEQVADDIAVMNEGTIIVHDDTQAILSRAGATCGPGNLEELFLKLTGTRLRDEE